MNLRGIMKRIRKKTGMTEKIIEAYESKKTTRNKIKKRTNPSKYFSLNDYKNHYFFNYNK